MISIESGPLSARFRPAWGGRMTHFTHTDLGDILVPTLEDVFEPYKWPRAGAYPLFPYHNRVSDASFRHAGQHHKLLPHPALTPDAMHGPAHRRPWTVESHAGNHVRLTLAYDADDEWPFSFFAEQSFLLEPHRLIVELAITNRAPVAAPVGFGWHPYIAAPLSSHAQTDARLEYSLDHKNIPTDAPARPRLDTRIPADTGYTLHLSDWSAASVYFGQAELLIEADPVFHHLAVHRMEGYLCVEPVSMAAGALSASQEQQKERGLKVAAPGERFSGCLTLSIRS